MACFCQLTGYRSATRNPDTGKRSIVWKPSERGFDEIQKIPCGQCIGCRLERSRQWAVRCQHESELHLANCFLTLTYDDAYLPKDRSLNQKHFQDFMKRLRKRFGYSKKKRPNGPKIRFFHCGEYGEKYGRPHYHAIIFGHDLRGPKVIGRSRNGEYPRYNSPALEALWSDPDTRQPYGLVEVGAVTPSSIAYVAGYCVKKVGQSLTPIIIDENGEFIPAEPEFILCSKNPAIGLRYWQKYGQQAVNHDNVVINGAKRPLPRYYDKKLAVDFPEEVIPLKTERVKRSKLNAANRTRARLAVREEITNARINQRKKTL